MLPSIKPTPLKNIAASCYINTALQLLSQLSLYICIDNYTPGDQENLLLHHILNIFSSPNHDITQDLVSVQEHVHKYRKFDKNKFDSPHTCLLALLTDPAITLQIEPLLQVDYIEHVQYTDTIFSSFQMVHPDNSSTLLTECQQNQMEEFVDNSLSCLRVDDVGNITLERYNDDAARIYFVAPDITAIDIVPLLLKTKNDDVNEQQHITSDIMMNIYTMETLVSKSSNIGFVVGDKTFKRKIRYAVGDWVPKNKFFILNSFIRDRTFKPPMMYKKGELVGLGLYGHYHWIACLQRNNQWWKCDDDNITLIETKDIIEYVNQNMFPFVIFYALYIVNMND
jgi:hypothetical protein